MSYKQLRHGGVLAVYSLIKKMGGQGRAEDQTIVKHLKFQDTQKNDVNTLKLNESCFTIE